MKLDGINQCAAIAGNNNQILFANVFNPFGEAFKRMSSEARKADVSQFNAIHISKSNVYSSHVQELLFAFHNIFAKLVESSAMDAEDITDRFSAALKLSRAYRAEMANFAQRVHSTLLRHQQYEDAAFGGESYISLLERIKGTGENAVEEEMREFESTQSLWYLFEIMHFDPSDNVTSQLRDWLQRTVEQPSYVSEFFEAFDPATMEFTLPYGREVNSAAYWAALEQLVLTGRVSVAVRMLHANELLDAKHPGLRDALISLLLQCPSMDYAPDVAELRHALQVPAEDEHADLENRFVRWRARVQDVIAGVERDRSRGALSALPFGNLLRVLQGDARTLGAVCVDWKHFMVATLLFRKPWASKADIAWLVDEAVATLPSTPTPYDDAVRTLLAQPAGPALRILDKLLAAPWVSAHLTDLYSRLHAIAIPLATVALAESPDLGMEEAASTAALACAKVDYAPVDGELPLGVRRWLSDPSAPQDLRELTLSTHARALAGLGLWVPAVTYFSACTHTWLPQLEQLLCSVQPTDANVEELLSVCAKLRLSHAHTRICGVMCARNLAAGRQAHAVHWALRGGDNARANAIADVLLTLAYADDDKTHARARGEVSLLSMLLAPVVVDADGMGTEIAFSLCPHNVATTAPTTVAVLFHLNDAWMLTDALASPRSTLVDTADALSAATGAVRATTSQRLAAQSQLTASQTQIAATAVAAAHALYCAMRIAPLRVARVLAISLAALGTLVERAGVSVCVCGEDAVLLALQCIEQGATLADYAKVPPPKSVREVLLGVDTAIGVEDESAGPFVSSAGTPVLLPLGASASDVLINCIVSEDDPSVALACDCEAAARQQLSTMLILAMQDLE